ncbi:MAG TPA: hypothetical protein VK490_06845 [Gaiellaceae bacterium]|jgi:hypothetical protein|nr:hypothetical protein [Gaiellaceae bacterium]
MSGGAVLWAETPDEDGEETPDSEAHGGVDDSFAARRLRRWIKGMFGGEPKSKPGGEADRPQSGPGEGARGNREVPPTDNPES